VAGVVVTGARDEMHIRPSVRSVGARCASRDTRRTIRPASNPLLVEGARPSVQTVHEWVESGGYGPNLRVRRCISDACQGSDWVDMSNVYLLTRTAAWARPEMRNKHLWACRSCTAAPHALTPSPRRPPHTGSRYRRRVYVAVSVVCPSRTGSDARRMSLAEGVPLSISGAESAYSVKR
jgi:hypothetical protein